MAVEADAAEDGEAEGDDEEGAAEGAVDGDDEEPNADEDGTVEGAEEGAGMDTLTGFEPTLTYTKSGNYFYKYLLGLGQE